MVRILMVSIFAVFLMALPAKAGSSDFTVSLYTCSDVYLGGKKVGDNCLQSYQAKLAHMESMEQGSNDD